MRDPIDAWAKRKFSKIERAVLHPAMGAFIACLMFFHLFSFSAITWCEQQGDYTSPLYFASVILAITSAIAGAAALIVIARTMEKLNSQNTIRIHADMCAWGTNDGRKEESERNNR